MVFKKLQKALHLFLWLILSPQIISAQPSEEPRLQLAQSLEREMKGGETHFYSIELTAGQLARVEVEQRGIDAILTAFDKNGATLAVADSPNGVTGKDAILIAANEAGKYRLEIKAGDPKGAGRYTVQLIELRAATQKDREQAAALTEIVGLVQEHIPLRAKGTSESRRQAIEKLLKGAEISNKFGEKFWEAVALTTSGLIYESLAERQKALDVYRRALPVWRELKNQQYEAVTLNNLGAVHNSIGERQRALEFYSQALPVRRASGDKRGEAVTLNNIGLVHLNLGNNGQALEFLKQALELRRAMKDERGEATTLSNLGLAAAALRDLPKAFEYYAQALELRRKTGDRQGEAVTLRNYGLAHWQAGELEKSFDYYSQALALWQTIGDRSGESDAMYWLGRLERERGELEKAIERVEKGLELAEDLRSDLVNPELRATYFSSVQQYFDLYIDLLLAKSEKSADKQKLINAALVASERARARNLLELLNEARIDIHEGADKKLLARERELQELLNSKARQKTQLLSGKPTPEQAARLSTEINELADEYQILRARLRESSPHYASLTQPQPLSVAEIQNLLDEQTVLLEYKLGAERSFLWTVSKTAVKVFVLPAQFEIDRLSKEFYEAATARNHDFSNKNAAQKRDFLQTADLKAVAIARKLGEMLLAPAASEIKNKRLAVVSEGMLQYIPFAVLSDTGENRPLFETNEIVNLPSAAVWAQLRTQATTPGRQAKTIAVFADPVFESDDPRLQAALGLKAGDNNFAVDNSKALPRLFASREEAETILAMVPENQATLAVDFDASRERAMSGELINYRIVHFATHGLLDTARPELSGLALSFFDRTGKSQDGFLRLHQIYNLNLSADLVVLSACQTALGRDIKGEGLIGLTRGFMYAGARRVMASLWKVDDEATSELMKHFYRNMFVKKLSPAASLRAAQIELRKNPRWQSPYFWSAFVLQGEWR